MSEVIRMATQPVNTQLRKTGIGVVGDVPWGTHFFLFYETKEDLLDALVPYFKAGLESGELCQWVVSEPLSEEEASNALREAVPEFDRYLADHSIEILRGHQFYFFSNDPDPGRVVRTWVERMNSALTRGYAGLRVSGSTAWLERKHWQSFCDYEKQLNNSIGNWRMTALCTYPLAGSTAAEVLDVARTHQFAIARRNRDWEVVETSELKQAKSEIKRLNDELERRVAERTVQLEALNQALKKEIAERQRAEKDLRRSEDHLRLVIDTIPQQIWTGPPDGSLDFCNAQWRSYMGFTQQDVQGDGWQRMLHPEDRERVLAAWHESVANGTPYEQQERHRRADGQYRWFLSRGVPLKDSQGRIVRWYGTNTDIDDRKKAEDRLQLVVDTTPAMLHSARPDGGLDFFNKRWLEYVGLSLDDMCGWRWTRVIHPDDVDDQVGKWRSSLATGEPFEAEVRVRRADGQYRWMLHRKVPAHDGQGNIFKWYGSVVDIEDRRRAEEALLEAQDKLAGVTRVQAMAELAAAIAHEVNQPLTAIVTNANFSLRQLRSTPPDLDELRTAIMEIVDDGTRASSVVSRIRGLLVHGTPHRAPLDINQIIRDVSAILRNELKRNRVSLRTDLVADVPRVNGDPVQVQQVLINLVVNAIEAMRTSAQLPRKLLIRSARNSGEVLVQVQDSGPGIKPEDADHIFEPFFSTKPEGTGMGLSICRSIVESHGGRLWTVPNSSGALFEFTLPFNGAGAS
jgi:PAS domain S-box-containing protein